ncbi:unnamed protein product [Brassica oleracea var. botrytis]
MNLASSSRHEPWLLHLSLPKTKQNQICNRATERRRYTYTKRERERERERDVDRGGGETRGKTVVVRREGDTVVVR